jgi:ATP synthase protein I
MTSGNGKPPRSDLGARLRAARAQADQDAGPAAGPSSGAARTASGMAYRMSVELVAGLVVGGGIGWLLDSWLHTLPAMTIVFFILGAAAGIMNVYRTAKAINRAAESEYQDGAPDANGDGDAGAGKEEGSDRGGRP